jgi:hypothetical protein
MKNAEAGHCDDEGVRTKARRVVRFNSLRQLYGSFAMGMRKWTPMERCPREHPKRNLVPRSSHRGHCPSTVSADLADPAPGSPLRGTGPSGHQTIEATPHLEDDSGPPTPRLSDRITESSTQPSTSAVIFRAWSSSSIIFLRWVTGTSL